MAKKTPITPWNKIKADYMAGAKPREIAEKYHLTAKVVSDKANKEKWVIERSEISEKVRENVQEKISNLTDKALDALESVIDNGSKESDIVQAAKAILEVSGLKSSKQEITGKDGAPLGVVKEYILPEEVEEIKKHVKEVTGG